MDIKRLLGHKILFVLVVLSTGMITWVSLAKISNPIDLDIKGSDKIAHAIVYFMFTNVWFFFFFFSDRNRMNFIQSITRASIVCFVYGALMETLQYFLTSYRSFEWNDMLANTSGIIFAALLLKVFENKLISFKEIVQ